MASTSNDLSVSAPGNNRLIMDIKCDKCNINVINVFCMIFARNGMIVIVLILVMLKSQMQTVNGFALDIDIHTKPLIWQSTKQK